MFIDAKIIKSVIADFMFKKKVQFVNLDNEPADLTDLAEYVYKSILILNTTVNQCQLIEEQILAEKKNCETRINELLQKKKEEQKLCRHDSTEYYGDTSGGTDRSQVCNLCGKVL